MTYRITYMDCFDDLVGQEVVIASRTAINAIASLHCVARKAHTFTLRRI